MKNQSKSLEKTIEEFAEQRMREHIAGLEKLAVQAVHLGVRRALDATAAATPVKQRGREKGSRKSGSSKRVNRTPEELEALEEQLHTAICAQPGEGMATYAAAVESTSEKLNRPMRGLRSAGRIRSVGRKGRARYFPTGD